MQALSLELIGLLANRCPSILFLSRRNRYAIRTVTHVSLSNASDGAPDNILEKYTRLISLSIHNTTAWRHILRSLPGSLRHLWSMNGTLTRSEVIHLPPLTSIDLSIDSDIDNVFDMLSSLPSSLTSLVVRSRHAVILSYAYFISHPNLTRIEGIIITSCPNEPEIDVDLTHVEALEVTPSLATANMPNIKKLILNCGMELEHRVINNIPLASLQVLCVCEWEVSAECVNALPNLMALYSIMRSEDVYGIKSPIGTLSVLFSDLLLCVLDINRLPKSVTNADIKRIQDIRLDKTKPHPNLIALGCDICPSTTTTGSIDLPDSLKMFELCTSHPHVNYTDCKNIHTLVLQDVILDNVLPGSLVVLPPNLEVLICNTHDKNLDNWDMCAPVILPSTLTCLSIPTIPQCWRGNEMSIAPSLVRLTELHIEDEVPEWVAPHLKSIVSISCNLSNALYLLPHPELMEELCILNDVDHVLIKALASFFPRDSIENLRYFGTHSRSYSL